MYRRSAQAERNGIGTWFGFLRRGRRGRARQRRAVAALGRMSREKAELDGILQQAADLVAQALDVEYGKVLLSDASGQSLRFAAGVGWEPGLVGEARVPAGLDSQAGYTLVSGGPVIVDDLATETRFRGPALLIDHGVVSGISVIIGGRETPFGVLGAHTTGRRRFTREDVDFMQAVADIVAAAVDRDRYERRLREAEARWHSILASSSDAIWTVDVDGRWTFVSPAFTEIMGYASEELIGRPFVEILRPDQIEEHLAIFPEILDGRPPARWERGYRHRDGHEVFVSVRFSRLRDARGRPIGVMGVSRDVTSTRMAVERIRVSEERLQSLRDSALDCIVSIDATGTILEFNPPAEQTFGFSRSEVLGKRLQETIIPARHREAHEAGMRRYLETGEARVIGRRVEMSAVCKDGREIPLELTVTPVCHGNVVTFTAFLRDLSVRKAAEARLHESEAAARRSAEVLGATMDSLPPPICVIDQDGVILSTNRAWNEFARANGSRGERDGVGTNYLEICERAASAGDDEAAQALRGIRSVIAGECLKFEMEYPCHSPNAERWFRLSAAPTTVGAAVVMHLDITESKKAARAVAESRDLALETAHRKSEFLARVSHEIRTPLSTVIGIVELLFQSAQPAAQRALTESALAAGGTLLSLLDDVLQFSRMSSESVEISAEEFDAGAVVEEILATFSQMARIKGLALHSRVSPELPDRLVGDAKRLRQILANLVSNAIKFTEKGEVVVSAHAEPTSAEAADLHLTVADTGIGIALEERERVFEPFRQLDSTDARSRGSVGLGLSICKQIAERMAGEISVDSAPGRGATFHVRVPLSTVGGAQPFGRDARGIAGRRLLIVCPAKTGREVLAAHAAAWGLEVEVADAVASAVETIRRGARSGAPHDVALVDRGAVGESNLELLKAARDSARRSFPRMALVTDGPPTQPWTDFERAGFSMELQTPIVRSELLECLVSLLGGEAPIRRPHPPSPPPLPAPERALRILAVEDSDLNRRVLELQLRQLGHEPTAVPDGVRALQSLRAATYDLVLLDCQMPGLDGYQTAKAIRAAEERGQHLPIIAITAGALGGDRERCLEVGMDDYLAKPVQLQALADVLSRWSNPIDPVTRSWLRRLRGSSGSTTVQDVTALFMNSASSEIHRLHEAIRSRDFPEISDAAHKLKGASASFGARGMQSLCERIESCGREGHLPEAEDLAHVLDSEFDQVRKVLAREPQGEPSEEAHP